MPTAALCLSPCGRSTVFNPARYFRQKTIQMLIHLQREPIRVFGCLYLLFLVSGSLNLVMKPERTPASLPRTLQAAF